MTRARASARLSAGQASTAQLGALNACALAVADRWSLGSVIVPVSPQHPAARVPGGPRAAGPLRRSVGVDYTPLRRRLQTRRPAVCGSQRARIMVAWPAAPDRLTMRRPSADLPRARRGRD